MTIHGLQQDPHPIRSSVLDGVCQRLLGYSVQDDFLCRLKTCVERRIDRGLEARLPPDSSELLLEGGDQSEVVERGWPELAHHLSEITHFLPDATLDLLDCLSLGGHGRLIEGPASSFQHHVQGGQVLDGSVVELSRHPLSFLLGRLNCPLEQLLLLQLEALQLSFRHDALGDVSSIEHHASDEGMVE